MSFATSVVVRTVGGVWVVAERRLMSSDCSVAMASSPHATGGEMRSMSTRNALYSGVSMFASPT